MMILGTISLLLFYFLTMTLLSRSASVAWEQFQNLWWIMIPLSVGFGIQLGLYLKLKRTLRDRAKKVIAGSNVEDIVNLVDNRGNIINFPKWIGSPPGGHHRSGELDFGQPLNQDARSVTLTLMNITGVSSRVFSWNLP